MARVLVTGASGFIGQHVIHELSLQGHEIIATGLRTDVEACPWLQNISYISRDLNRKHENYYDFFQQPDLLIRLAWSGLPNYSGLFHIEENLTANYYFLKNMLGNGLSDLTVIGTCFEYGRQNGQLREDMPCFPDNAYAIAKDSLRRFLTELQKGMNFDLKWLRLFYMFGEGQSEKSLLSQLIKAVELKQETFNMSGGEQLRDYLPVEQVAANIIKAALQNDVKGIINCCSGKPLSVRQLVENKLQVLQYSMTLNLGYYPYSEHEAMAFWGCTKKQESIQMAEDSI